MRTMHTMPNASETAGPSMVWLGAGFALRACQPCPDDGCLGLGRSGAEWGLRAECQPRHLSLSMGNRAGHGREPHLAMPCTV
jgi:hypothetical protein